MHSYPAYYARVFGTNYLPFNGAKIPAIYCVRDFIHARWKSLGLKVQNVGQLWADVAKGPDTDCILRKVSCITEA